MRFTPIFAILLAPTVLGWGVVGHEVVATIAQIHLHPSAQKMIKQLLPDSSLSQISTWADRIRGIPDFRWTGQLHYTSPVADHPPDVCHFGDKGFLTDHDVLHAVSNFTQKLIDNPRDWLALRLLVHFLADLHQPLHLTNRAKGGNGDPVRFEGRRMSMHGLWDGGLITKAVREQKTYKTALPSRQIEDQLRGTIYDPYIRLILWEGVRIWWREELPTWFECNPRLDFAPAPPSLLKQLFFSPKPVAEVSTVVCPNTWGAETHKITCNYVYPMDYDPKAIPEMRTEQYYGPIRDGHIIEKLLAQGGLRLAATLNRIFASEEEMKEGAIRLLEY